MKIFLYSILKEKEQSSQKLKLRLSCLIIWNKKMRKHKLENVKIWVKTELTKLLFHSFILSLFHHRTHHLTFKSTTLYQLS